MKANLANVPRYAVESVKGLAYVEGKDADPVKHKLDLFLPRDHKDFPVLVFVHGGAWQRGDKSGHFGVYGSLGTFLARHGVGTVVINYRLSPQVKHPEHVKDVARAVAWTCRNIKRYGGDPDRIFVAGHSAGAHLVSLLATDETYLKEQGQSVKQIKGVISVSGVYFLPDNVFGKVFGTDAEAHRKAWPLEHVKAGLPPFLVLYADKDLPGCDKGPAEEFCRALKRKGNQVASAEAHNSSHYKILLSLTLADDPMVQAVFGFIQSHLASP